MKMRDKMAGRMRPREYSYCDSRGEEDARVPLCIDQ